MDWKSQVQLKKKIEKLSFSHKIKFFWWKLKNLVLQIENPFFFFAIKFVCFKFCCFYSQAWKAVGEWCDSECVCVGGCVGVCMYVYVPVWLGFRYSDLLWKVEKLKSDYNQTWVKDAIWVPSYVCEVKVM